MPTKPALGNPARYDHEAHGRQEEAAADPVRLDPLLARQGQPAEPVEPQQQVEQGAGDPGQQQEGEAQRPGSADERGQRRMPTGRGRGEDLPAEDEAEDDDPLGHAALPPHPEEEARASPDRPGSAPSAPRRSRPGPIPARGRSGAPRGSAPGPGRGRPVEQGPALVGVRQRVLGVVGQRRAEGLRRPRPCGRAGPGPWRGG